MEQTDLEVLSQFEAVWQRVQRSNQVSEENSMGDMQMLMDALYDRMCGCSQLAKFSCGTSKKRLMEMSQQLRRRYANLQLWCFLESGDIHFANETTKFASCTPYNLRKLWQSTVKNMEMIEKCSLNEDAKLVAEFQEMKQEFEQQKQVLEEIIGQFLK